MSDPIQDALPGLGVEELGHLWDVPVVGTGRTAEAMCGRVEVLRTHVEAEREFLRALGTPQAGLIEFWAYAPEQDCE